MMSTRQLGRSPFWNKSQRAIAPLALVKNGAHFLGIWKVISLFGAVSAIVL
ncbi:hypothetical protein [Microcoleus sp. CAWBG640]|uniref:hypothetical protein n=1 Tax=Microcoleus sp. CAWBG640 TaxID=2841653 RepID=UPI00312B840E